MAVEDRLREREKAYAWAGALCGYAGADREFLEDFWGRLTADEEIYEEFVYYLEHQDFLCKVKIEGYGLVDPDSRDFLAVDQDVGPFHAGGGHHAAAF